jgi:hypothetical protein
MTANRPIKTAAVAAVMTWLAGAATTAGYYCTNNSKQDYQFATPAGTWDESSRKAHWRNRDQKDQPFFAVFNFTGCHESGIASESKYRSVTKKLAREERQDPMKEGLKCQKGFNSNGKYRVRVINRALNELNGTNNVVS